MGAAQLEGEVASRGLTPVVSTVSSCQMISEVSGSRVPSRFARRGFRNSPSETVPGVSSARLRVARRAPRPL